MRWSWKEDYIVCKFSYEHAWKVVTVKQLNCLMLELQQQGFGQRSKLAVDKRARDYQCLFCHRQSP